MKKKLLLIFTLLLLFIFSNSALAIETATPKFADPYDSSWQRFNTKTDVPADKVWTIDFSRGFSSEEISAITVQCDDVFVPVKITQLDEGRATVDPIEDYQPGKKYCLKILLENGKKYYMYFYVAEFQEYSRLNPTPIYIEREIHDEKQSFETRITELFRGEGAFEIACAMYDWNKSKTPPEGYEYLLIKVATTYKQLSGEDESYNIDRYKFDLYTQNYEEYTVDSNLHFPSLYRYDRTVYNGGHSEGYISFLVKKTDKYPVIKYNPTYDNSIWFRGWR
jgi:hypothetical protein